MPAKKLIFFKFTLALVLVILALSFYSLSFDLTAGICLLALFGLSAAIFLVSYEDYKLSERILSRTDVAKSFAHSANNSIWFHEALRPRLPLPPLAGWALDPETAGYLYKSIIREKPAVILELGSGVSTLIMAYALDSNGTGHIYSFDAEKKFSERSTSVLEAHDLVEYASVTHAPLVDYTNSNYGSKWYESSAFSSVPDGSVDIILVDGPPEKTSHLARYPALPRLCKKLKKNALIILDDAERKGEKAIIQKWLEEGYIEDNPKFYSIGTGVCIARAR
ncbi:putative O-methyltransferase YrrM [Methylohalomonas lacus]|uniref:O-methyltransferase YrrM n=1 Tax=Methylohalomonas lacus TaxID=398773 RepID=A0AAE3HN98_9GAMM|nr:class I SAM-dependent methyltransferase [Methylohalomonas lacus]MCS3904381.1 putative O-methyltransferase YrrM [Methylohalomonas lacus]